MALTTDGNGHEPHYDLPQPDPRLGPDDVVRIVLDALQHNDDPGPDCGVRVAFNFASPGNRSSTGPLRKFAAMVKNPAYRILIGFREAKVEPVVLVGERARVVARVTGADGAAKAFAFELSRQTVSPYRECWMADSVLPVE